MFSILKRVPESWKLTSIQPRNPKSKPGAFHANPQSQSKNLFPHLSLVYQSPFRSATEHMSLFLSSSTTPIVPNSFLVRSLGPTSSTRFPRPDSPSKSKQVQRGYLFPLRLFDRLPLYSTSLIPLVKFPFILPDATDDGWNGHTVGIAIHLSLFEDGVSDYEGGDLRVVTFNCRFNNVSRTLINNLLSNILCTAADFFRFGCEIYRNLATNGGRTRTDKPIIPSIS